MSALKGNGLVPLSGRRRRYSGEDFPMLRPDAPPIERGRPFRDDLAKCDRMFGASARVTRPARRRVVTLPDPRLPLPARAFIGLHVAYGGVLAPLTFRIAGGDYTAGSSIARVTTLDALFGAVERAFAVKRLEMISHRRAPVCARPRFALCLLATEFTDWSFPRIGAALGGRDHSTIIHAVRRARALEARDRDYALALDRARALLRADLGAEAAP